eukprot:gnl/TRDRNA2_/TRDRNA2_205996_c0_seq1.p1 gnl/TRDRNA2_/TRDRNA2_205996_c0~~gnl/TRDRNA2_/TRDRNA2_205996_c0_seq1.p1  ORF type:complete len:222 (-),score=31.60 gnl/TRDRNA2_/TRDRNA2_205996_c0_seq1:232-831(-)
MGDAGPPPAAALEDGAARAGFSRRRSMGDVVVECMGARHRSLVSRRASGSLCNSSGPRDESLVATEDASSSRKSAEQPRRRSYMEAKSAEVYNTSTLTSLFSNRDSSFMDAEDADVSNALEVLASDPTAAPSKQLGRNIADLQIPAGYGTRVGGVPMPQGHKNSVGHIVKQQQRPQQSAQHSPQDAASSRMAAEFMSNH